MEYFVSKLVTTTDNDDSDLVFFVLIIAILNCFNIYVLVIVILGISILFLI